MVVPGRAPDIRAWRPPVAGVREAFHARFTEHAYPLHIQDDWTLFIVDEGAIRYRLHSHLRVAEPPMVSILPPGVVHDGRTATAGGFRERVLYLEPGALDDSLVGPAVDRSVILVTGLREQISALHDALAIADREIEAETRLAFVIDRIAAAFGSPGAEPPPLSRDDQAEHLRAFLDAHLFEKVTIAAAATAIGARPTQLARSFSAVYGLPPHAYVLGRRVEAARERILGGESIAGVAAEVGFCDQAHLSRRFTRFMGMTPGRYVRAGRIASAQR